MTKNKKTLLLNLKGERMINIRKVLLLTIVALFTIKNIFAGLSIDKTFILFEKNNKSDTIRVYNQENKVKYYNVNLVNYINKEDGSYDISEKPLKNSANDLLIYTPKTIRIDPFGYQTIRIQRTNTLDVADGDYVSFIKIQETFDPNEVAVNTEKEAKENANSIGVQIVPLFAISFPVVVRKGPANSNVDITDASLTYQTDDLHLDVMLLRSGNTSSRGSVLVKLNNEVVGQIKGINIFSNTNKRSVSIPLTRSANLEKILGSKRTTKFTLEYVDEASGKVKNTYELQVN